MKTVIGLFDEFQVAELGINRLLDRHFDRDAISLVANNVEAHYVSDESSDIQRGGRPLDRLLHGLAGVTRRARAPAVSRNASLHTFAE